ncbi:MAG: hypothetical protein AB8E15_04820 [Bdellovibrionales bacterium]
MEKTLLKNQKASISLSLLLFTGSFVAASVFLAAQFITQSQYNKAQKECFTNQLQAQANLANTLNKIETIYNPAAKVLQLKMLLLEAKAIAAMASPNLYAVIGAEILALRHKQKKLFQFTKKSLDFVLLARTTQIRIKDPLSDIPQFKYELKPKASASPTFNFNQPNTSKIQSRFHLQENSFLNRLKGVLKSQANLDLNKSLSMRGTFFNEQFKCKTILFKRKKLWISRIVN